MKDFLDIVVYPAILGVVLFIGRSIVRVGNSLEEWKNETSGKVDAISDKVEALSDETKKANLSAKRAEFIVYTLKDHGDKSTLLQLYDDYHEEGGNSYATKLKNDTLEKWENNKKIEGE